MLGVDPPFFLTQIEMCVWGHLWIESKKLSHLRFFWSDFPTGWKDFSKNHSQILALKSLLNCLEFLTFFRPIESQILDIWGGSRRTCPLLVRHPIAGRFWDRSASSMCICTCIYIWLYMNIDVKTSRRVGNRASGWTLFEKKLFWRCGAVHILWWTLP